MAITLLLYIVRWPDDRALLYGTGAAVVVWLLLAALAQPFATIDRANRAVYRDLRARLSALQLEYQSALHPSRRELLVNYENDLDPVAGHLRELQRELSASES